MSLPGNATVQPALTARKVSGGEVACLVSELGIFKRLSFIFENLFTASLKVVQVIGNLFLLQILRKRLINSTELVGGESQETVSDTWSAAVIDNDLPSIIEPPK